MGNRRLLLQVASISLLAPILYACATVETVQTARGSGVKRTFKQPFDEVYSAALTAAEKRKLQLIKDERSRGTILLSHGASFLSLGEHIALFLSPLGQRSTSVEVVAKPVVSALSVAPD